MGDGDNGVQQIDRRSCQGLVEQIRHQADGDTARLPAEQRPSQQVAANSNFAGPDGTGSLHPGELAYRVAVAPPMRASWAATRIAQQLSHPGLEMEQPAVGFQLVSYQSSRVGRYRPMPAVFEDPAVRLRQMSVPRRALTSRPIPVTLECLPLTNKRDRGRPNLPRMSPKRRAKGILNMLLSVEIQLLYNRGKLCIYFMVNYCVVDGLSSGRVAAPLHG